MAVLRYKGLTIGANPLGEGQKGCRLLLRYRDHSCTATLRPLLLVAVLAVVLIVGGSLWHWSRPPVVPLSVDAALAAGDLDALERLYRSGALRIDARDANGRCPLERAMLANSMAAAKFLIERGADINDPDQQGNTLLDRMLAAGKEDMVILLKSAGAKRNVNKNFARGKLNLIPWPGGASTKLDIDLLGDGIGQTLTIEKEKDSPKHATVTVVKGSQELVSFKVSMFNDASWLYVAYLPNEEVPVLIYLFDNLKPGYMTDLSIIGRLGQGSLGPLFRLDSNEMHVIHDLYNLGGPNARLSLAGGNLAVTTSRGRTALEWNKEKAYFRLRDVGPRNETAPLSNAYRAWVKVFRDEQSKSNVYIDSNDVLVKVGKEALFSVLAIRQIYDAPLADRSQIVTMRIETESHFDFPNKNKFQTWWVYTYDLSGNEISQSYSEPWLPLPPGSVIEKCLEQSYPWRKPGNF